MLTFIKSEAGYTSPTVIAGTDRLDYVALRRGTRFILTVNGYEHGNPSTLATVKASAEADFLERLATADRKAKERVKKAAPRPIRTVADVNRDQAAEMEAAISPIVDTYDPTVVDATAQDIADFLRPNADKLIREERGITVVTPSKPSLLAQKLTTPKPRSTAPHLLIVARAGTGKTTTLVEGLKKLKGMPSSFTPSPQQKAIWDLMAEGADKVRTVCFVAFNKSIAVELQGRVPMGCEASTMHSMGMKAVRRAFPKINVNEYRVADIISRLLEREIREMRKEDPVLLRATEQMVGFCKQNLIATDMADDEDRTNLDEVLDGLAFHYGVELTDEESGKDYTRQVFDLIPRVMDACRDVATDGVIDFNDMIWLPSVLNIPLFRYDVLLVDEAQDLNRAQQAMARRAGDRLILCGDNRQAIYGFAGADATSMPRMGEELGATPRGCVTLPLTVTRRCGKAIVKEAQKLVPDFEAFEANPEGKISRAVYKQEEGRVTVTYHADVKDGDMILCGYNAPLVNQCFKFLAMGRRASVQGRDISRGLITLIHTMGASTVPQLVQRISDWLHQEMMKEQAKRNPLETKLIALQDKADCVLAMTDGMNTVADVEARINTLFTDDKNVKGIKLSSVHKAKGTEAHRVYLLEPKGCSIPHPMAKSGWQLEQGYNLRYVAITRAIEELIYVS